MSAWDGTLGETCTIHEFGAFRLDTGRRLLTSEGAPVALSSRAFDILQMLVEQRGRVLSKEEIMLRVWRGTIVEDNNLAVQISALRRALGGTPEGAPIIVTVPGQGYRFVAPVTARSDGDEPVGIAVGTADGASTTAKRDHSGQRVLPARPAAAPRDWLVLAACGVAAVVVGVLVLDGFGARSPPHALTSSPVVAGPPRLSLVVLPFRNLGDAREEEELADAISDDLTTDLSHLPGSVVIARATADSYKGRAVPTDQIGRALNVRYVLEGSLRGADSMLSINAQLIEAATGSHLWAERFEVPRAHISEAQQSAVRRIASALGARLMQIEGAAAGRKDLREQDALDLFFRARSLLDNSDTIESMATAQGLLEQAVGKKPDFVDALGALSWLLLRKINGFADPTDRADLEEARRIVDRLLVLAPGTAQALASHGFLQVTDGQVEAAEASYQAALAVEPNSIPALTGLVQCQSRLGRFDQASVNLEKLVRLDPEQSRNRTRFYQLGLASLMLGQPRDAITWLQQAAAGDPDPVPGADAAGRVEWGHILLIGAAAMAGDMAQARDAYARYAAIWPHRTVWHLAALDTKAMTRLPAFQRLQDALAAAGMPRFADEHGDDHVPQADAPVAHGGFDPTPVAVPGVPTIDTAGLQRLLASGRGPVIVDRGHGAAAPAGAVIARFDPLSRDAAAVFIQTTIGGSAAIEGRPVVVMGDSTYGWASYNATLALKAAGLKNLIWYRGGEEAWAAANMPATDRRAP